jgi:hypothetical protein
MDYDNYDFIDNDGGYDDSEDEVVNDIPTPEEVAAFWSEVRPDVGLPF